MKEEIHILYSNSSASSIGYVTGEIIVDPTLGGLLGGVQASEHRIGNADGDVDVGTRERLEDERVRVEELDLGEVVGFQELHHLGRRQRVGGGGTPVHTHRSVNPIETRARYGQQ
ncbi:hypothetical protein U1Q18_047579 [Sarracenia purpurea var. burkii]